MRRKPEGTVWSHKEGRRVHVSRAEFEDWLDRELRRDPYGRVSAEVVLYGAPRLYKGRDYVVDRP